MTNADRTPNVAYELAEATQDAYSFHSYGPKNWLACCELLLSRGYNAVEVECIMRSVHTRLAYDRRLRARAKGTAADLANLIDEHSGGDVQWREYVDETVAAQMIDEPVKLASRDALRLAWSR